MENGCRPRIRRAFWNGCTIVGPRDVSIRIPAALATRLVSLAARHERVVVKVSDGAGALGNVVGRSSYIVGLSLPTLRLRILDTLNERGWTGSYPLIVGVWDRPVIASPSVNVWVPKPEDGAPVLEGVFSQILSGESGEFIGAESSDLPDTVERRLTHEALMLAHLFQDLGFFGRCGFDAVLVGSSLAGAEVHWVECNGRWGGVSIAIILVNRLVGDWHRRSILIVQRTQPEMPPRPFGPVLRSLDRKRLRRPPDKTGVVVLTPGRMVDDSGANLMVLAETKAAARAEAQSAAALLRSQTVLNNPLQ